MKYGAEGSSQLTGGLVQMLSAPEGSLFWAAGMRQEIQNCLHEPDVDNEYVTHCISLLLRSGGWRSLRDERGQEFRSFVRLCYAKPPHGLGFSRSQLEKLLPD